MELQAKLTITGTFAKLEGDYLIDDIRELTSWYVEGAQFSKAFKSGKWDGRKHLFNLKTGVFPAGLVPTILSALESWNIPCDVYDEREDPSNHDGTFDLEGITFDYPYDYQLSTAEKMVKEKRGIVNVATSGGKTEISCAVTNKLQLKTLFIVPTKELLHQSRKRFMARLGATEEEIGIVGDSKWKPGSWVTIATLDILEARSKKPECVDLLSETELLFVDECHKTGSTTYYDTCMSCHATYRFGLSGTPLDRTDGADLRLIAAFGEVLVKIKNKFLVDRGVSARAKILCDKTTEPVLPKKTRYPTAYRLGVTENEEMLQKIVDWTEIFYKKGLSTLILIEETKHGRLINDALWNNTETFIPHQFIYGEDQTEERAEALRGLADRSLPVLISSKILDEGVDVPTIDALIVAGSRKSKIKTLQRLGRGLRGKKLLVVEFMNFCHNYLCEHGFERLQDYKAEDCFPIHSSAPDASLVEYLWDEYEKSAAEKGYPQVREVLPASLTKVSDDE